MIRRGHASICSSALQSGYSLIEVMIAMTVALFLLAGIVTVLQGTRNTSTSQNRLAQVQDEERIAMTLLTDTIQQAGYFPGADTVAPASVFTADALFGTAGQVVVGQPNPFNAAYGDTVTIRYEGDATNGVIDCRGQPIPNGTSEEMTFQIKPQPGTSQPELVCTVNGADSQLVTNVQELQILYGIDTTASGSSVDAYLPSAQMGSYWTDVNSVKIKITFGNPLAGQPGQNPTLTFTRVIGVMMNLGPNVFSST